MHETSASEPPPRTELSQPSETRVPEQRVGEGSRAVHGHTEFGDVEPELADADDKVMGHQGNNAVVPQGSTGEAALPQAEPDDGSSQTQDRSPYSESNREVDNPKEQEVPRLDLSQPSETRVPEQRVDEEGPGDGHILTGLVKEDGKPESSDRDDKALDRRVDSGLPRETTEEARDVPRRESAMAESDINNPSITETLPDQAVVPNKYSTTTPSDTHQTTEGATGGGPDQPVQAEATDQTRAAPNEIDTPSAQDVPPRTEPWTTASGGEPATVPHTEGSTREAAGTAEEPTQGQAPLKELVGAFGGNHLDDHAEAPLSAEPTGDETEARGRGPDASDNGKSPAKPGIMPAKTDISGTAAEATSEVIHTDTEPNHGTDDPHRQASELERPQTQQEEAAGAGRDREELPKELADVVVLAPRGRPGDAVSVGESISYKEGRLPKSGGRGRRNDNLTVDHIPSRAALVYAEQEKIWREQEVRLGRPLALEDEDDLLLDSGEVSRINDEGIGIVKTAGEHRERSRTYAGRNTDQQIKQDARDLGEAVRKDFSAYLSRLPSGEITQKDVAIYVQHYRNLVKKGVIEYSKKTNEMLLAYLKEAT